MRIAFDSNILVYLAGVVSADSDHAKIAAATDMVRRLQSRATIVLPSQTLGELYTALCKAERPREQAKSVITDLADTYAIVGSGRETALAALDLAVDHRLQFWDSLILTAAAEADCSLLLSEDMHDGFLWRGVTIADPFAAELQPKLAQLLAA